MRKNLSGLLVALSLSVASIAPGYAQPASTDIDFGDDSGEFANDGECDDPRFFGDASAAELMDEDLLKDATDCKTAFEAGTVLVKSTDTTATKNIDFGDDSSRWAKDGECDDPRFTGAKMAASLDDKDIRADATDCKAAFEAGIVTLIGAEAATEVTSTKASDIEFGDDTSNWANDGECDDPRFEGAGMAAKPSSDNYMSDASDCRAAYENGEVTLADGYGSTTTPSEPEPFSYGSNDSKYAFDQVCDDPRFMGEGTDKKLLQSDLGKDAADCTALEVSGKVSIRPVYQPDYVTKAPYDTKDIDFGNDDSDYAFDDVCDDPRFEGPGAANVLYEEDEYADATDCEAAFIAGSIALISQ
jgi:hypothetical protein